MSTDTSEKGLEGLIVAWMTGETAQAASGPRGVLEPSAAYGGGWLLGDAHAYVRDCQTQRLNACDTEVHFLGRVALLKRARSEDLYAISPGFKSH